LFKIATQGVSMWHFHVYPYYSLIWFISSVLFLSIVVPFSGGFKWFKSSIFILVYRVHQPYSTS
jgi:hypothetical protein